MYSLNLVIGYHLPPPEIKNWYRWIQYAMPTSHWPPTSASGFFGDSAILVTIVENGSSVAIKRTVAEYIEDEYDFRPNVKRGFVAGLLGFWVAVQLAIYLKLK